MKELQKSTKNLTILYVEDDVTIRMQLILTFKMLFKDVFIACNGEEGVAIYKEHGNKIDIIITDIQMPIMNGLDMSKHIRLINGDTHIIVVSAHNDLEYFSKAIEIGIDGFIIKPIQTVQLKQSLHKSIKNLKLQKDNKLYQEGLEKLVIAKTKELEEFYLHDSLTGCFNRQKLDEVLLKNDFSYLMLINLDNLDSINSTYGYATGDTVLKLFANFLKELQLVDGYLFRLAGDEFVILCGCGCVLEKEIMASKIIDSLSKKKFKIGEFSIHLSCTIGIANQNNQESNESALVRAHAAMKETREIGKNRFHVYAAESPYITKQKSNITWMLKVREALTNNAIVPYYQPIIDNKTMKIVKYECLARLVDFNSIIAPYYFIEPARLAGLLPKITETMFVKAFKYFQNKSHGFSLNITEDDLRANYLPSFLKHLANEYTIDPSMVTLEILENISAYGSQQALEQLLELKDAGFKLALDDFGSEKSNFCRLQQMNVDYIKIDGSFIKDINTNKNNLDICKTIVHLAQSIKCEVIAEFVHSKDVFETVKNIGIPYSQGYYFGEPKSIIEHC
ncbi:MAG: hypothetical protein RL154_177 [Pseudomonadota bacterium]